MKIKTVLVAGLAGGIGYVLGARAGEERYEQITATASSLAARPEVQQATQAVTDPERRRQLLGRLRGGSTS